MVVLYVVIPATFKRFKLKTCAFSGDANNHAHMEGYQVSNQCMALVRDNCLLPTIDAPELAYVRESTNEQYVPDVFYKVGFDFAYCIVKFLILLFCTYFYIIV